MVATIALWALNVHPQGQPFDAALLEKLATKVVEIGQKGSPDKHAAHFLKLENKAIHWHSKFDSERQVQVWGEKKDRRLVFLVPEKPFPEFGKTWLYAVGVDGKGLQAGSADPREDFKRLPTNDASAKAARAEIDYWVAELAIKKG